MQPYIPVQAHQAEIVYNWDGQRCENVVHYVTTGDVFVADLKNLANALVTWWNVNFKAWMPTTLSLVEVKVTDMRTRTSPVAFADAGLPVVGTNSSASLPNQCACVVTKRTALRGRSYRGRIYVPGLIELQTTNNQVTPTYVTNYINAWNAAKHITTTLVDWDMCVVSKVQDGIPLPGGITTLVTGFTCDGVVDTQRRRIPGRGA